jgi:putative tricarboxylic transport membrane protein
LKRYDLISGVIWIIIALLLCIESVRLGIGSFRDPDAGLFPFFTGVLMGLFSILLLLEAMFKKGRAKEEKVIVWSKETLWKNPILTSLALVAYALIMEKVGYLLTTFVFIVFLSKTIEPQKWSLSILEAIITVLLSYLIFNVWLQCQFPDGILLEWVKNML